VVRDGRAQDDWVAEEEPLEIQVEGQPLMVTMRTPGHDRELAAGFLFTEGVIRKGTDLVAMNRCRDPLAYDPDNLLEVSLSRVARGREKQLRRARREFAAVAGCGLCGKGRLEDVFQRLPTIRPMATELSFLQPLPALMAEHQTLFHATGGLHAAALFNSAGEHLALFEDIGRHNAVDKLIGHFLLRDELPLEDRVLVVSSRAGFEIVQKAMMASVPVLATLGAASSMAVRMAVDGGMALFSFVGPGRGNRHL
jgi:FdhD protein